MKDMITTEEKNERERLAYQTKAARESQAHQVWNTQKQALWTRINRQVEALDRWYSKLPWTEQTKEDRQYHRDRATLIQIRVNEEDLLHQAWLAEINAATEAHRITQRQIQQAWLAFLEAEKQARQRQQYQAYEQQYEREQEYRRPGHEPASSKPEAPAEFKQLWKAYHRRFHPNLFFSHPNCAALDDLGKQVNAAYDRRRPDFPHFLAQVTRQAEALVAA